VIVDMNWVDMIITILMIYFVYKGSKLGLISSVFRMISFFFSAYLASRYHSFIYEFIINNRFLYGIFEKATGFILNLILQSRINESSDSLLRLMSGGMVKPVISLASIIIIFVLANMLLKTVLGIISLLFRIPILKSLNKAGGMIFGFLQGFIIVYFFNMVFQKFAAFIPDSRLGEGIDSSLILAYLQNIDLIDLFLNFSNKKFI